MNEEKKRAKSHYGIVNFERRRYPRFSVNLPIEYCRKDSSIGVPGRTDNMSEGGLFVYLPEQMKVGQLLKLKLFFASIDEPVYTMEVMAEVVWIGSETGETTVNHLCGLKFIEGTPMDMKKLKDFLKSLTR